MPQWGHSQLKLRLGAVCSGQECFWLGVLPTPAQNPSLLAFSWGLLIDPRQLLQARAHPHCRVFFCQGEMHRTSTKNGIVCRGGTRLRGDVSATWAVKLGVKERSPTLVIPSAAIQRHTKCHWTSLSVTFCWSLPEFDPCVADSTVASSTVCRSFVHVCVGVGDRVCAGVDFSGIKVLKTMTFHIRTHEKSPSASNVRVSIFFVKSRNALLRVSRNALLHLSRNALVRVSLFTSCQRQNGSSVWHPKTLNPLPPLLSSSLPKPQLATPQPPSPPFHPSPPGPSGNVRVRPTPLWPIGSFDLRHFSLRNFTLLKNRPSWSLSAHSGRWDDFVPALGRRRRR